MALRSGIEWTQSTWNPVTGCTKISAGCRHCYAERMARRLQAMGQPNYRNGFELTCHPESLDLPLRWKKPQRVFVNSMSDLFHADVPLDFIQRVFATMREARQHIFQVLTKRGRRLAELSPLLDWTENIWMMDFGLGAGEGIDGNVIPSGVEESGWEREACLVLGQTHSTALRFAQGDKEGGWRR